MVSARAGNQPGARSLELEPMPVEDGVEGNRLAGGGREVVFDWVLDGDPPQEGQRDVLGSQPELRERRDSVAPRPGQVRAARTRFVARNRIEEPAEWLPETPLPRGHAMTKAGRQAQNNWLPFLLSVLAVGVLALVVAALVMQDHRGPRPLPEGFRQPAGQEPAGEEPVGQPAE